MADEHIPGGYNGRILRVDLTEGTVWTENLDEKFCRKYIGGAGFIAHYLYNELKPGSDPLGPENMIIFANGPLTGTSISGTARNCIGTKSPLTGGIAKSEVGGHWGAELAHAGFDALIIKGKASHPVYLNIKDGQASIGDAGYLWGKTTGDTVALLRQELKRQQNGDSQYRSRRRKAGAVRLHYERAARCGRARGHRRCHGFQKPQSHLRPRPYAEPGGIAGWRGEIEGLAPAKPAAVGKLRSIRHRWHRCRHRLHGEDRKCLGQEFPRRHFP